MTEMPNPASGQYVAVEKQGSCELDHTDKKNAPRQRGETSLREETL